MSKIGFIGLGHMGGPMAENLVKAGHSLTVYDVAPVSLEKVKVATSLAELVKEVDYIVSMLPAGAHVR
ncbi:MAG: NAD(P)-binding domain-containing protein, partial [Gammaproteobacteria bacterium]|nr:NAD(P)-binding domain-containing protein [Gammaproteobacteria bacterium]